MTIQTISKIILGDMLLHFVEDTESHKVGFYMIPAALDEKDISEQKLCRINSMVQLKMVGDNYPPCYGHGQTMRNSDSSNLLEYDSQSVEETEGKTIIHTYLRDQRGYEVINEIVYYLGDHSVEMKNTFQNNSQEQVTLEMISSFEMGNMTPFISELAEDSLLVHRLRSKWSHEGRLITDTVEDLQLEPSWSTWSVGVERFGAVGSMPVLKYFPFVGIEDKKNHVLWGAQLAVESSWQMEIYRQDDGLHISGGLADREFGHWIKHIAAGERFTTPTAIITVCEGDIDLLCHRLVSNGQKYVNQGPKEEQRLPIIFNEYCTTWGCPSHENITGIVETIRQKGIDYFVIDCGWFKEDGIPWDISMGDYNISKSLFPNGLEETVSFIKEAGMRPGIWFEIDNVGKASQAYHNTDHLLKRDGIPLTTYSRRFWDMNDPWVEKYLTEKVIGTLKKYGFGYMKMDYNDTIGIGVDGCESLGEGLRQDREASVAFVEKVKREISDIVLENCASGGHKLEPQMMRLCSMASFSDAHETGEIPIIAANLHRCILPRQSQIWAVIRKDDSLKRIGYSIANTFLGRMCLSGDVTELTREQWDVIDRGIAFYKEVAPIIKEGLSHRIGPKIVSDRRPTGYQAILREAENGDQLVVIHCFHGDLPKEIRISLDGYPGSRFERHNAPDRIIAEVFSYDESAEVILVDGEIVYYPTENQNAIAVKIKTHI